MIKFASDGLVLRSSKISTSQLPNILTVSFKVVKSDSKIITKIYRRYKRIPVVNFINIKHTNFSFERTFL